MRYDFVRGARSRAMDDGLSAFVKVRRRLFGIAYRMLGSAAEAEDVVQDVWTRWQSTDRRVVRDPQAFLATTTTRLAINVLQSARARHESYVGSWLPELVDTSADPTLGAERGEALELAVLVLLERLPPTERAALCCAKPSTTRIKTLRRFSTSKRRTRASSSPARGSMSRMDGVHVSAKPSRDACSRRLSLLRKPAISPSLSACLPRTLS